jgi:hypothetical protein
MIKRTDTKNMSAINTREITPNNLHTVIFLNSNLNE